MSTPPSSYIRLAVLSRTKLLGESDADGDPANDASPAAFALLRGDRGDRLPNPLKVLRSWLEARANEDGLASAGLPTVGMISVSSVDEVCSILTL